MSSIRRAKFLLVSIVSSTIFLIFIIWSLNESEELERFQDVLLAQEFEIKTVSSPSISIETSTNRFVSEDFDEIKVSEAFPEQNIFLEEKNEQENNLTDLEDRLKTELAVKEYSYNTIVSDTIPLGRDIPDTRPLSCQDLTYNHNIIPVSVVIVFHNEYLSVLLRSIHSILNRTPTQLLTEVILVDDASSKDFLFLLEFPNLLTDFN